MFYLHIIICFSSFSQETTNSLVSSSNLWSMVSYYIIGDDIFYGISEYIKFSGDTIIETTPYKIVLESTDSMKENWIQIGYIRKEGNKVFARKKDDPAEGLMYDFNVKINDTLAIKNPFFRIDPIDSLDYNDMIVTAIDSINILNGKRKRITLLNDDYYDYDYWVEGIGSLMGVINSCGFSIGGYSTLLCFWDDNQLKYSNPEYDNCFITDIPSIKSTQNWQSEIIVYPNPASDIVTFIINENIKDQLLSLKIFKTNGQLFHSVYLMDNYSLDISQMKNGLYFFSLTSLDNKISTYGKFIKQ